MTRHVLRSAIAVAVVVACSPPRIPPAPPPLRPQPLPPDAAAAPEPAPAPIAVDDDPPPVRRAPQPGPFRLPHDFAPSRVRLRLAFAPSDARLTGHIEIDGTLAAPTDRLWLAGRDLTIVTAVATRGAETVSLAHDHEGANHVFALASTAPLAAGAWTLALDYTAPIADYATTGAFHRVVDGRAYAFARGGMVDARRYMPGFDEPDRKVPWELALDIPEDLVAASNAAIAHEAPLPSKRKRVTFAATSPLPSALVTFAVGPFDVLAVGPTTRVLSIHGDDGAPFARVATDVMAELARTIDVPYGYAKLDFVEVPIDDRQIPVVAAPGLVGATQEVWLAVDRRIQLRPALARLWFGGLVTPAWWDDRWLADGLAAYVAASAWRPNRRVDGLALARSGTSVAFAASSSKALDNAQVREAVEHGEGVVTLAATKLGAAAVQRALRTYLLAHAHGTATTADLMAVLAPGRADVARLLDHVPPSISARIECTKGPSHAELDMADVDAPLDLCIAYERDGKRADACARVGPTTTDLALPAHRCPPWILLDPTATGLYTSTAPYADEVVDRGWPWLSTAERVALVTTLEWQDTDAKRAAFARLAAAGVALPDEEVWGTVVEIANTVDDAHLARLRAWVELHYGARIRAEHLLDVTDFRMLMLGVEFHVPWLVREAADIVKHPPAHGYDWQLDAYQLAADDPKVLRELLLAMRTAGNPDEIADSLSWRRDIVRALLANPGVASAKQVVELVSHVCDPVGVAALAQLAASLPDVDFARPIREATECRDRAKQREAALRVWLK